MSGRRGSLRPPPSHSAACRCPAPGALRCALPAPEPRIPWLPPGGLSRERDGSGFDRHQLSPPLPPPPPPFSPPPPFPPAAPGPCLPAPCCISRSPRPSRRGGGGWAALIARDAEHRAAAAPVAATRARCAATSGARGAPTGRGWAAGCGGRGSPLGGAGLGAGGRRYPALGTETQRCVAPATAERRSEPALEVPARRKGHPPAAPRYFPEPYASCLSRTTLVRSTQRLLIST